MAGLLEVQNRDPVGMDKPAFELKRRYLVMRYDVGDKGPPVVGGTDDLPQNTGPSEVLEEPKIG